MRRQAMAYAGLGALGAAAAAILACGVTSDRWALLVTVVAMAVLTRLAFADEPHRGALIAGSGIGLAGPLVVGQLSGRFAAADVIELVLLGTVSLAVAWSVGFALVKHRRAWLGPLGVVAVVVAAVLVVGAPTGVPETTLADADPLDATDGTYLRIEPQQRDELGRSCIGGKCYPLWHDGERVRVLEPLVDQGDALSLRRRGDSVYVYANQRLVSVGDPSTHSWDRPRDGFAAPRPSPAAAFLGLMVALVAVAARYGANRVSRRAQQAREGHVDAAGWLHLTGGAAGEAPQRLALAAGPILLESVPQREQPYRGSVREEAPRTLARSDRETYLRRLERVRDICGGLMLATASIAAAISIGSWL